MEHFMKRTFFISLLLLLASVVSVSFAEPVPKKTDNPPVRLKDGLKLVYDIKFGLLGNNGGTTEMIVEVRKLKDTNEGTVFEWSTKVAGLQVPGAVVQGSDDKIQVLYSKDKKYYVFDEDGKKKSGNNKNFVDVEKGKTEKNKTTRKGIEFETEYERLDDEKIEFENKKYDSKVIKQSTKYNGTEMSAKVWYITIENVELQI
jgi:hypothetical protein